MRSGADCHVNAKRSLSVIHSWFTVGSSPASRRSTTPRRWSTRMADPWESCSPTPGVRHQVERARPEPVRRAGQGADRADLHGVAREVADANGRPEVSSAAAPSGASPSNPRIVVSNRPICWLAPRFCRSMNTSPAISSENRVQRWHRMQRSRSSRICVEIAIGLGNVRLTSTNRVLRAPVAHRLVLQRALAALVADRAVERVVDEQQLHDAVLGLVGLGRRVLRLDLHARAGLERAAGLRLGHLGQLAVAAGRPDLDQALAAGAGRGEQRVVAEPRDLDAQLLGGADDQRALGHLGLDAVDGERDRGRRAPPAFRPGADGTSFVVGPLDRIVMRGPPRGRRSCAACR